MNMKVCTITMVDGKPMFDGVQCGSADNAYLLYRNRYNKALGKATHKKYGHVGQRTDRITKVGIDFEKEYLESLRDEFSGEPKVNGYIIGLIGTTYCRMFGIDGHDGDEEFSERYIDWLMSSGMPGIRLCGRRDKIRRTINTKRK